MRIFALFMSVVCGALALICGTLAVNAQLHGDYAKASVMLICFAINCGLVVLQTWIANDIAVRRR